ncbi:MAG: hypothetical protein EOP61_17000, partial [Sphingomonadales bacterium]
MKRLHALLAATMLSACASGPPATDTATAPAPAPVQTAAAPQAAAGPVDAAEVAAGQKVFETFCAACHNGADDTAPQIATLHTFDHQRVSAALSDQGLMALQSKMLNPEQRKHVIAFITAPVDMGGNGMRAVMTAKEEYREGFAYPVRSARDPRD